MTAGKFMTWQVGAVRVTRVAELAGIPFDSAYMFAQSTPQRVQRHAWLAPHFACADGRLLGSIHSFVIEAGKRRIIVDTGVGNDKSRRVKTWNRRQGPFLDDLAQAGYPADSIDTVLCTHLHVDHVGWNTVLLDGRWAPTFRNARYVFGRREWEYWRAEQAAQRADESMADSVQPIVEAGMAELVDMNHALTTEVWLEPTPGHTPGHVSVRISSLGKDAVITGDLIHHPLQCAEPDLATNFDLDDDVARRTRHDFLARCANRPTLVLGTHFAPPTGGWVVDAGRAWRFDGAPAAFCDER